MRLRAYLAFQKSSLYAGARRCRHRYLISCVRLRAFLAERDVSQCALWRGVAVEWISWDSALATINLYLSSLCLIVFLWKTINRIHQWTFSTLIWEQKRFRPTCIGLFILNAVDQIWRQEAAWHGRRWTIQALVIRNNEREDESDDSIHSNDKIDIIFIEHFSAFCYSGHL